MTACFLRKYQENILWLGERKDHHCCKQRQKINGEKISIVYLNELYASIKFKDLQEKAIGCFSLLQWDLFIISANLNRVVVKVYKS